MPRSDSAIIRVLALQPYPLDGAPGQRFRLEQWAPHLKSQGIEIEFSPFLDAAGREIIHRPGFSRQKIAALWRGYRARLRDLQRLDQFDIVHVYSEAAFLGTPWIERRIAGRRPLIFDFDDAIYLRDTSPANRNFRFLKMPGKVETTCRLASAVTVSNETLAKFARRHSQTVIVIPPSLEMSDYRRERRQHNPVPIVGWTGSLTMVSTLSLLTTALQKLRRKVDFRLRVIGAPFRLDDFPVECLDWQAGTEVQDLLPIDVGLSPLRDDEWCRGKFTFKTLQYMALGIAPVVSPVGTNAELVRDGVDGFHARTEAEWVDRILTLLRDPSLRVQMGESARSRVSERCASARQAAQLAGVFRQALK